MSDQKLSPSFYRRPDVVSIARDLVGKVLCTQIGNAPLTSGIITETEAYCGREDKACHANNNTRTDRTETMYQPGGIAYIYLCYGIHHLFNVVTNVEGMADAVLIRAIQPLDGKDVMLERRGKQNVKPTLTAGPGRLTQALGITTDWDGTILTENRIWIEDRAIGLSAAPFIATERVGVDYADEDAKLPWRFYPQNSSWVSKK